MSYEVFDKDTNERLAGPFTTPPEAIEKAKELATQGIYARVREVIDDGWKETQRTLFETGELSHVPWSKEEWADEQVFNEFFPSLISEGKSTGLISYVESPKKGSRGIRTVISPGKFITRFYSSLDDRTVQKWVAVCQEMFFSLQILTDPTEIAEIYHKNSPMRSCMTYDLTEYRTNGRHPCELYGLGDLALAVLYRGEEPIARSVVYPLKKFYSRCYGHIEAMEHMLKAQGWRRGNFAGARLPIVPIDGRDNYWLMPYIDNSYESLSDNRSHPMTVRNGYFYLQRETGYNFSTTSGAIAERDLVRCDCGEIVNPDQHYNYPRYCESCYSRCTDCDIVTPHEDLEQGLCPVCHERHELLANVSEPVS